MGKKNPFVMTVGFNKNNPDHIRVAEFLNSLGRTKGQYIVRAVTMYQRYLEDGHESVHGIIDYEQIREYVLKVVTEWKEKESNSSGTAKEKNTSDKSAVKGDDQFVEAFIEKGFADSILQALDEFGNY